jgi:hypothetical protein
MIVKFWQPGWAKDRPEFSPEIMIFFCAYILLWPKAKEERNFKT